MVDLGKNIRKLRHLKGWNQKDAASPLDISIPAYSKIETGVTDINLSRLEQIAGLFDLSAVELLSYGVSANNSNAATLPAINSRFSDR